VPKVTFIMGDQVKTVDGPDGQTILQIALDNAIPMEHACGGNGFCTTCMCSVKEGMEHLNERNDREENMGISMDPYRLSCQARVKGNGDVTAELEGY
jgi:2Fe-2S ferredoxin